MTNTQRTHNLKIKCEGVSVATVVASEEGVKSLIFYPGVSEDVRQKVSRVFSEVNLESEGAKEHYAEEGLQLTRNSERVSGEFEANEGMIRRVADCIYESNLMEGIIEISYSEIAKGLRHGSEKGCVGAWRMMHEKALSKEDLTMEDICMMQELLTEEQNRFDHPIEPERRGVIRSHMAKINGIPLKIPSVAEVEAHMARISDEIDKLNPKDLESVLRFAARQHFEFENIHPFADGNGRVGRLIVNYILIRIGLHPLIFTSDDKERYIDGFSAGPGIQRETADKLEQYIIEQYRLQK